MSDPYAAIGAPQAAADPYAQVGAPADPSYGWHTYEQRGGQTVAVPAVAPDAPVSLSGAAKAAGSGLVMGVTGLADSMSPSNDVASMLRLLGHGQVADALAPTTASGSAQGLGLDYQPTNTAERYTKSIAEMAPNALLGPEGILPRVAAAVVPGVLSQGGADLAQAAGAGPMGQAAARVAGGVLGGGLTAGAGSLGKINTTDILPAAEAPVANVVRKALALGQSTPADVHAGISQGILPVATSPGLAGVGEAVASTPGPAGVLLRDAISTRMGDQTDRALGAVQEHLGVDPAAARGDVESVVQAGRKAADPLYRPLRENPAPVMTSELASLAQTPAVKKAIGFAVTDMLNDPKGPQPTALGFKLDPDTGAWSIPDSTSLTGVAEQQPTAATWIKVHQALGKTVERNPITNAVLPDSASPANVNISKVSGYLRDALAGDPVTGEGAAIPGYGDALKTSGDYLSVNNAFSRTRGKLFAGNVGDFADLWGSLKTDAERNAARSALANDVLVTADRNQNGLNPGRFRAPGVQKKLGIAFGDDAASKFVDQMESDAAEKATYNQITGNSRTTPRAALIGAFQNEKPKGVLGAMQGVTGAADTLASFTHPLTAFTKTMSLISKGGKAKAAVLPWDDPMTATQLGGVLGNGDQMAGLLGRMAAADAATKRIGDFRQGQLLTQPALAGLLEYQPQRRAGILQ